MRFYQDVIQVEEPRETLSRIADLLLPQSEVLDGPKPARPARIEQLRDALILAGMLEQGIADLLPASAADGCLARRAAALTDGCAAGLIATWQGTSSLESPATVALAPLSSALNGIGPVAITVPEGYLFYALYPELYWWLGESLGHGWEQARVVVVGVRSIGTSLSALVAEALRRCGCTPSRFTVRPSGDPFAREVSLPGAHRRLLRQAARAGAHAVAVDEGPGLSGSSLAAVVAALTDAGFPPERLAVACAAPPGGLPQATAATRRIWESVCWHAASEHEHRLWGQALPELLSGAAHGSLRPVADLSWGAWSAYRPDLGGTPLAVSTLERRKLLLEDAEGPVLAKFVGFGAVGRRKACLAASLAAAGFAPPVLGHAQGLLLQRWLPRALLPDTAPIAVAADYYAHLHRHCRVGESTLDEPLEIAGTIVRGWFGAAREREWERIRAAGRGIVVQQTDGDGKPEPVEWLADGGAIRKADAADHFLDHSWARAQDSLFDLAGFSQEFALTPIQEGALLRRYVEQSGDDAAPARLPFYRVLYAAHRLAALDTAFHAAIPAAAPRLDAERRRHGEALARALMVE